MITKQNFRDNITPSLPTHKRPFSFVFCGKMFDLRVVDEFLIFFQLGKLVSLFIISGRSDVHCLINRNCNKIRSRRYAFNSDILAEYTRMFREIKIPRGRHLNYPGRVFMFASRLLCGSNLYTARFSLTF